MLPTFILEKPATLQAACGLKAKGGKAFAGGTDVLVSMHNGDLRPDMLIDLKGIGDMQGISFSPEAEVRIGSLVTHRQIEDWEIARQYYTALYEGCSRVGSVQTRTRGTIGGNLCNAAPSGDSIGPLYALDARVEIAGRAGKRVIPIGEFFAGPKRTVLKEDELLCAILLPPPVCHAGSAYYKYTRRNAMDLALIGIACYIRMDGERIGKARVALSTCAPTVIYAQGAQTFLQGKEPDVKVFQEAGRLAAADSSPRTSWRAGKDFRLRLIENLVPTVLQRAAAAAKEALK